jgi:hypothetical protein
MYNDFPEDGELKLLIRAPAVSAGKDGIIAIRH